MRRREGAALLSAIAHHPTIDGNHALLWGHDHVEDEEVTLQPVGYVVLSGPGVIHGCDELQVFDYLWFCLWHNGIRPTGVGMSNPLKCSCFSCVRAGSDYR